MTHSHGRGRPWLRRDTKLGCSHFLSIFDLMISLAQHAGRPGTRFKLLVKNKPSTKVPPDSETFPRISKPGLRRCFVSPSRGGHRLR